MSKEFIIKLRYNPDEDRVEISGGDDTFEPAYFEVEGKQVEIPKDMIPFIDGDILGLA